MALRTAFVSLLVCKVMNVCELSCLWAPTVASYTPHTDLAAFGTPRSKLGRASRTMAETWLELSHDPLWFCGLGIEFVSSLAGTLGKQSWRLAAIAAPGPLLCSHSVARYLYAFGCLLTLIGACAALYARVPA